MNPETKFRKKATKILSKLPNSVGFSIQQVGIIGTPDTFYCINGWFVSLEFKRSESAHKIPLQVYNTNKINRAGGFGFFVYPENWQDVLSFLTLLSSDEGKKHGYAHLRRTAESLFLPSDAKDRDGDVV